VSPVSIGLLSLPAEAAAGEWPLLAFAFAFAIGACIGSFLNVCIHRLPADESVVRPRSRCPQCGTAIAWHDNIPLVSWALLRARCRTCGISISARYPLVELVTGALAVLAVARFGAVPLALTCFAFSAALVLITFIDLDHRFIPDEVSLPGIGVGLVVSLLPGGVGLVDAALGAVIGGGSLWLVAWGYERLTGREGMGYGDVKLLAMIGAFLGWQSVPAVVIVASLTGSVAGLAVMLDRSGRARLARVWRRLGPIAALASLRRSSRRTEIPFGPFLALGALVALYLPDLALPIELVAHG
jgi:leader peptidase (prepilin peptidase)/N-methyltransferase